MVFYASPFAKLEYCILPTQCGSELWMILRIKDDRVRTDITRPLFDYQDKMNATNDSSSSLFKLQMVRLLCCYVPSKSSVKYEA